LTVRTREIPFPGSYEGQLDRHYIDRGDSRNDYRVLTTSTNPDVVAFLTGTQTTASENHPAWRTHKRGHFKGDYGGPFSSQRKYCVTPSGTHRDFSARRSYEPSSLFPEGRFVDKVDYSGPVLPCAPNLLPFPAYMGSSSKELDLKGATAIAQCSPSNPTVDLTTAIGELFHDGIPHVVGGVLKSWRNLSARDRRKAIGDEYLNVEFGWKPFVNDLRDTCHAIIHAHDILSQYARDSGRMVRRKHDFKPETGNNTAIWRDGVSPWWNPSHGIFSSPDSNQGKVLATETWSKRQWFRGAFTYYVPPSDSVRNGIALNVIQARKLLGLSLTPDSLWNLAPWSWAVDWFTNVGDVLSNWTDWAIDNQVLVYGYMMEHTFHQYTFTFAGPTGIADGGARPGDFTLVAETKVRRQASPYGFGINWEDLSSRQKAIVAALGLSRSR